MITFTGFILKVCFDQVSFMAGLMQPKVLRERIVRLGGEEIGYGNVPAQAPRVLDAILFKGGLPRAEVATAIGQSKRLARNVATALSKEGIIFSCGPRDEWRIAFPRHTCASSDAMIVFVEGERLMRLAGLCLNLWRESAEGGMLIDPSDLWYRQAAIEVLLGKVPRRPVLGRVQSIFAMKA